MKKVHCRTLIVCTVLVDAPMLKMLQCSIQNLSLKLEDEKGQNYVEQGACLCCKKTGSSPLLGSWTFRRAGEGLGRMYIPFLSLFPFLKIWESFYFHSKAERKQMSKPQHFLKNQNLVLQPVLSNRTYAKSPDFPIKNIGLGRDLLDHQVQSLVTASNHII